eukprot:2587614-Alexandrium_andersonii.AAC.1
MAASLLDGSGSDYSEHESEQPASGARAKAKACGGKSHIALATAGVGENATGLACKCFTCGVSWK